MVEEATNNAYWSNGIVKEISVNYVGPLNEQPYNDFNDENSKDFNEHSPSFLLSSNYRTTIKNKSVREEYNKEVRSSF